MVTCCESKVELLLQMKSTPSGATHVPQYPTRTTIFALPTMVAILDATAGLTCEELYSGT